jgi:chromate transporter
MPISSGYASSCRPASSRVGFSIGLMRAGYPGGLAAWTGFTLPSAIVLVLFAYGAGALSGPAGTGLLHGLKLVAVAIVAQAVWGMARSLCPDRERASIAAIAAALRPVDRACFATTPRASACRLSLCRSPSRALTGAP